MKRFFFLLMFAFLLNGCDDGDLEVESFDFSTATTQKCFSATDNFFLYKVNQKEALIVQLDEEDNFPNEVTPDGAPRVVDISATNKVIYRLYDGDLSTESVCSAIPSSSPNVTE